MLYELHPKTELSWKSKQYALNQLFYTNQNNQLFWSAFAIGNVLFFYGLEVFRLAF